MKSNATTAGVLALTAALLIGNALAAADDDKAKDEPKDDVKSLREDLDKLKKRVDLDSRLNNIELKTINERLERIEAALEKLDGKARSRTSSSFTPRGDTGTLRLDNRMAVEAEVTIDGTSYRVPAGSVRTLTEQPAGTFSYTVTGTGLGTARKRTVLSRGETLTVRITPPPVTALRVIYDE